KNRRLRCPNSSASLIKIGSPQLLHVTVFRKKHLLAMRPSSANRVFVRWIQESESGWASQERRRVSNHSKSWLGSPGQQRNPPTCSSSSAVRFAGAESVPRSAAGFPQEST